MKFGKCGIVSACLPEDACGIGVADGARTHDHWNHNPGLYQLSYSHRSENKQHIHMMGLDPTKNLSSEMWASN